MKRDAPLFSLTVGTGWVACGRHVPAWRRIPTGEFKFVVDTDTEVARRRPAELGLDVVDYSEVLNDPGTDSVDICGPHDLYVRTAPQAIKAGGHVLAEKPLAMDSVAAEKLVAAEQARTVGMIAENWQHAPVATVAQELLRSRAIGDPLLFSGRSCRAVRTVSLRGGWTLRRAVARAP